MGVHAKNPQLVLSAVLPLRTDMVGEVSVNKLYFSRGGRRILTTTGRAYKRQVTLKLAQTWTLLTTDINKDVPYSLDLIFYLPQVYTKGWPGKAQNRFKKIDVSNLVKFFQDCIAAASGVDDSSHFETFIKKIEDPENPRLDIRLTQMAEDEVWM